MKPYYLVNAVGLRRRGNTLEAQFTNGRRRSIPIERVSDLYVFSELDLNTALLRFLGKCGVCVHFFNYFGYYVGSYVPRTTLVSGYLLVRQVEHYIDDDKRLSIAREFVRAGLMNIYRNLRYYSQRGRDVSDAMQGVSRAIKGAKEASSINSLMGYEGGARSCYYRAWPAIIKQDVEFERRVKHPPDNLLNALISFSNGLVYSTVLSEIYKTQLNPTVSFLHEPGDRRFSLSLDLSEIFKPLLADRMVITLLNRMQLTEDSLDKESKQLTLSDGALKTVLQEYDKRLSTTIMHRTLGREVSYRRLIRLEAYKLTKHLLGEQPYEGFVIWW